jgi:NADPH2:quinone reductase
MVGLKYNIKFLVSNEDAMTNLPETMNCVEVKEPGGPEALVPAIRPVPEAGEGEVLIKVAAAGINGPDIYQRKGLYPPRPGQTDLPGLEVSGTIVALGEGAQGWKVGDKVCALTNGGGYAEYCIAPDTQCLPIPKGLSMIEAAGVPETFFTVWFNLFQRAGLQKGESILIHGGAGGIGTTAVQLGSAMGANVIVTESSDEKCQACLDLGATKAINYMTEDFVDPVREFGGGKGVNMILDVVGGDYVEKNIKALGPNGRLINIAFLKGSKVDINLMPVMLKGLKLMGSVLRSQPQKVKAKIADELKEQVWPLLEAGEVKPVIYKELPLSKAAEGHRIMEGAGHVGKIMLAT